MAARSRRSRPGTSPGPAEPRTQNRGADRPASPSPPGAQGPHARHQSCRNAQTSWNLPPLACGRGRAALRGAGSRQCVAAFDRFNESDSLPSTNARGRGTRVRPIVDGCRTSAGQRRVSPTPQNGRQSAANWRGLSSYLLWPARATSNHATICASKRMVIAPLDHAPACSAQPNPSPLRSPEPWAWQQQTLRTPRTGA